MPYMPVAAIELAIDAVASSFPALARTITLPETSVEGRTIKALHLGTLSPSTRSGVLLVGGIHAREMVNPETLIEFAMRLCAARHASSGLAFGPKTYSSTDVQVIMDTLDIVVLPMANPDGRAYCLAAPANAMWRKNRSNHPGLSCRGVDLNRNTDFLWPSGIGTSNNACSDVFKGPSAFSEPETRNVRWLIDTYPRLYCMVDVHSYSELVLFPWGDDELQTTDADQNFRNPAFDGQRGVVGGGYREYMPANDLSAHQAMGNRIRKGIAAVRGRSYTVQQSISLYPTTATWHDYAYARQFVETGRRRILGFTVETAREFQPADAEKAAVISETQAGLMECLLQSVCPAEAVQSLASTPALKLEAMRAFRDQRMLATAKGQRIEADFRRHAGELVSLLGSNKQAFKSALVALRAASEMAQRSEKPIGEPEAAALDDVFKLFMAIGSPQLKADLAKALSGVGRLKGAELDKIFKAPATAPKAASKAAPRKRSPPKASAGSGKAKTTRRP